MLLFRMMMIDNVKNADSGEIIVAHDDDQTEALTFS